MSCGSEVQARRRYYCSLTGDPEETWWAMFDRHLGGDYGDQTLCTKVPQLASSVDVDVDVELAITSVVPHEGRAMMQYGVTAPHSPA